MMDSDQDVAVTLPYWKWMYFLGWINGQEPSSNNVLDGILREIASAVVTSPAIEHP